MTGSWLLRVFFLSPTYSRLGAERPVTQIYQEHKHLARKEKLVFSWPKDQKEKPNKERARGQPTPYSIPRAAAAQSHPQWQWSLVSWGPPLSGRKVARAHSSEPHRSAVGQEVPHSPAGNSSTNKQINRSSDSWGTKQASALEAITETMVQQRRPEPTL